MRLLITGPNKCGKSLKAENILTSLSQNLVYIATLPRLEENIERINNHLLRRDSRWQTYELNGDWAYDYSRLYRLFNDGHPVLLDGLSIMIWQSLNYCSNQRRHEALRSITFLLIDLLKNSSSDWIIVDADPLQINQVLPSSFYKTIRDTHKSIKKINGIKNITILAFN